MVQKHSSVKQIFTNSWIEGNIPVLFQGICRNIAPVLLEQSLARDVRHIPTEIKILVGLNLSVGEGVDK